MQETTEVKSSSIGCFAWAIIIIFCIAWLNPAPSWLGCVNCHCQTVQKAP